jgi:hypothetical protein
MVFSNTSERPKSRSRDRSRSRSRSQSRRHRSRRHRSRTLSSDTEEDRKRERRHRTSRKYDDEDIETGHPDSQDYINDKGRRRSHDKSRRRSSKPRRESSKDRRRHKHRSRSRSPTRGDDISPASLTNGDEKDVEKKYRDKYRDRSRDREREERDKDRRDRDKKRSRRERSESRESDRHHRSSRRTKKDKERDRDDRDYDRDASSTPKTSQPQTPVEPETEFKIQGRSKDRKKPLPTGPAAMQPPTGPRTQTQPRDQIKLSLETRKPLPAPRAPLSSRRGPSNSHPPTPTSTSNTAPPTPPSTAPIDPYQQERENARKARELKEEQRRASLHGPAASTNPPGRKRSFETIADTVEAALMPPTGPKGERRGAKRARDGEGRSSGKARRTSYKYEDEDFDERRFSKAESEREAARYN